MDLVGYKKDIKLEKKFSEQIKSILGNYFFSQNVEYDQKYATDFAIFTIPNREIRVGIRLRRYKYFLKYSEQFTIRWERPSGVNTEIHKIRKGLVNYILYGFINEEENDIIQYFIGNLDVFRSYESKPVRIYDNIPFDSKLAVYNISQFPSEFILYYHKPVLDEIEMETYW